MANKISLTAFLGLDSSGMDQGLKKAEGSAKSSGAAIGSALSSGIMVLGAAAAEAAAAAAAAIASFVKTSIAEFVEFEEKMNEVFTLLPGLSKSAEKKMTLDAQNLARQFGILPDEVVPALYQAISAGVPKENVFDFMEIASRAAIGGVSTLETAVDALSTAVNTYGAENLTAEEAADAMFTAVKLGKTNFEQLGSTMSNVIPVANAMGVDFDQVMAAVATLTKQGVPTAQAMTQIRSALQALGSPTTRQSEFLQALGVDTEAMKKALAGPNGLAVAMGMMEKAAAGDNEKLRKMVGSVEALQGILGVTARGGAIMAEAMDAMANKAGANDVAFGKMNESLKRTFEALKATVSVGLTNAGAAFSRLLVSMGPALQRIADAFADLDWRGVSQAMVNIGRAIGPSLMQLADAIGELMREVVGLLGEADSGKSILVTIIDALITVVRIIKEAIVFVREIKSIWDTVSNAIGGVSGKADDFFANLRKNHKLIYGFFWPFEMAKKLLGAMRSPISTIVKGLASAKDMVSGIGVIISEVITEALRFVIKQLEKLLSGAANAIAYIDEDAANAMRRASVSLMKADKDLANRRKKLEQEENARRRKDWEERKKLRDQEHAEAMKLKAAEEEQARKAANAQLDAQRKGMFALTKKPFWLTATIEDLKQVNKETLDSAKRALDLANVSKVAAEIGPRKSIKIGDIEVGRDEAMSVLGMTPEQIMARRRLFSVSEIKSFDKGLSELIKESRRKEKEVQKAAQKDAETQQENMRKGFFNMIQKAGGPSAAMHAQMRAALNADQRAKFDKEMLALYQKGLAMHRAEIAKANAEILGQPMSGVYGNVPTEQGMILSRPMPTARTTPMATTQFQPRQVGPAKPVPVKVDTQEMMKRMNTFYGTAIKDIQKSLRSIDNSLKGKFVNQ